MRMVRVYTEFKDNKDADPLSFDLIIDDKNRVVGDGYMLGLLGKPEESGECYPFAFLGDGSMDFGVASTDDRWWKSDLRGQPIVPNGTLKVWDGSEKEFEYRIAKIVDLPEPG